MTKKTRFSIRSRYDSVEIVEKQQVATLKTHPLEKIQNNNNNLFVPANNIPNHWWNFSRIPDYDQNSGWKLVKIE